MVNATAQPIPASRALPMVAAAPSPDQVRLIEIVERLHQAQRPTPCVHYFAGARERAAQ